jgi:regulator of replication initiation timing
MSKEKTGKESLSSPKKIITNLLSTNSEQDLKTLINYLNTLNKDGQKAIARNFQLRELALKRIIAAIQAEAKKPQVKKQSENSRQKENKQDPLQQLADFFLICLEQ